MYYVVYENRKLRYVQTRIKTVGNSFLKRNESFTDSKSIHKIEVTEKIYFVGKIHIYYFHCSM